jgi:hypothetical protein
VLGSAGARSVLLPGKQTHGDVLSALLLLMLSLLLMITICDTDTAMHECTSLCAAEAASINSKAHLELFLHQAVQLIQHTISCTVHAAKLTLHLYVAM